MNPIVSALAGTLITLLGTTIGAAMVFLVKRELSPLINKLFLGLASGVMIAAAIWSLLLPSASYAQEAGIWPWLPMLVGFLTGALFLYLTKKLFPSGNQSGKGNSRMVLAVTLHNFPEGMAVGLACALAAIAQSGAMLAGAIALSIGVAIQNIPEGAIIALPLVGEGKSKRKAFAGGFLSGVVEPIAGVIGAAITSFTLALIPWTLSFAAGAMIYVVVDELVPDAVSDKGDLGTIGAIVGFALMMMLDVMLG